ncbi:MAG: peptidoglycan DD-metalloendopeptidase family protein [Clostridiaceae bacterium]|nr:peptidoglycan DD-metalloendopeptidase family protein [Clostridiaceae bacterium]
MEGRRKKFASVIAVLLALSLVFSLLAGLLSAYASDKSKLSDLKSQLATITSERKEIASQLAELNAQMQSMLEQKAALEQEINLTYEQIALTEEIIASLDASIEQTTADLEAAEAEEAKQYAVFKTRLRAMYENDSLTVLDLILSASSLTEYYSRMEAATSIASYDKKLMKTLAETREYIEELKESLEADLAESEQQKEDLIEYKRDLVKQNVELDLLIEDLKEQTDLTQSELDAVEAEEAAFEKEIAALAEKIRKDEAAAAAAAAAANTAASASKYTGGTMTWPLPGYYSISSDFVMRNHPITGKYQQHTGIDLPAPKNTKIVAACSGTVVTVGYNKAYGNRVVINHGGGVQTLYAHMTSYAVSEGDTVSAGDVIGYVGSTGYSTGNHLHFSVLLNGSYVDPKPYLQG